MSPDLLLGLAALFVGVAVITGAVAAAVLSWRAPERRRLGQMTTASAGIVLETPGLIDSPNPLLNRARAFVPKSPKEMTLLRRRLTSAGYPGIDVVVIYSVVRIALPIAFGLATLMLTTGPSSVVLAALAAMFGFMVPEFWIARKTRLRQKVIRNGLPDALDLFIVCLEAGSSLDQAIVKASDELDIAYPPLAEELRYITTEIRAGKPRIEAFKNFAQRTRVDDVRSLVAMLVQTDRFGTSVAQALRTHAEQSRTIRRQRAEERAAKLSVKLVIPLVMFLFPALYVVVLGPAFIKIMRVFGSGQVGGLGQ